MKRFIALILAVLMCLSLCACGGGTKESETTLSEQESLENELRGHWWCLNRNFDMGKDVSFDDGKWSYSAEKGTLTQLNELDVEDAKEYKVINHQGVYIMVGDITYVHNSSYESNKEAFEASTKTIELTKDNWTEYFQLYTGVREKFDKWGEKTGEETYYHYALKQVYYTRHLYGKSQIKLRATISGSTNDFKGDSIGGLTIDYLNNELPPIEEVEVEKLEGTLTYIDF